MTYDALPRNWLIVDDHVGDAELIARAIPEGSKIVDVAHDLKTAETQLKQKIYDIVVLDYYFKGTSETGLNLIPIIRKLFPGLPLIMISSSDEVEVVSAAIREGADVFVKKYPNDKLLRSSLTVAAIQAQESRNVQSDKNIYAHLFISPTIRAELAATVRKRNEKVLISGPRGGGRTSMGQAFAATFIRSYYKNSPRSIIYVDCTDKNVEVALFGDRDENFQLSAFERAQGGVLLLDDLDTLSPELQDRLKRIFLAQVYESSIGEEINLKKIKIISTSSNHITEESAGLVASATDLEISLETIASLANHVDKVVEKLAIRDIPFTAKALEYLANAMRVIDWKMGFISLSQFINSAICHAMENGKQKVYQGDFPTLEPYDRGLRLDPEKQLFPGKDGELLLHTIRSGRNFQTAQKLLKKVMIQYAEELYEGNIKAAAEALGISRSAFAE